MATTNTSTEYRAHPHPGRMGAGSLMALALVTLGLHGCASQEDAGLFKLNGRLEAPTVDIAPRIPGRVIEVKVREGDRVKKGDLLIRLDLGDVALAVARDTAALDAAKDRYADLAAGSRPPEIATARAEVADRHAATELARLDLAREEQLKAKHVGPERDYDRARIDLERAQAAEQASTQRLALAVEGFRSFQTQQAKNELERARTVLDQSRIVAQESTLTAPADAVVLHRIAEPGLLLGVGQSGMTLAFAGRLYVRAFIPEPRLGLVRQGQKVSVQVDTFEGRKFPATVTEISPEPEFTPKAVETKTERVNLVYAAKIDLDAGWAEPLVPGQPAEVMIPTTAVPAR